MARGRRNDKANKSEAILDSEALLWTADDKLGNNLDAAESSGEQQIQHWEIRGIC